MFPTPLETAQTGERFARTDASASALDAAVEFPRGSLDDLDAKGGAAAASDGVIHLALKTRGGALATRLEARQQLPPARQEDGVLSAFRSRASQRPWVWRVFWTVEQWT